MQILNHGGDIYSYEKKYGRTPIDFSSSINPLGMPHSTKRAIINNLDKLSIYPDMLCTELKRSIARKEKTEQDYIFCTNGASEALYLIAAAIKPKKALIPAPVFSGYEESLCAVKTEIVYYNTNEDNDFKTEENIIDYIDQSIDIIYLCNPNNPTGEVLKDSLLEKIISTAELKGCYLLIDESFMDFLEDGKSAKKYLKEYKNLIILKSYTKTYALAGVRAGFIFTSNKDLLNKIKLNTPLWNVSALASICVISAVEDEKYIKESIEYIAEERKRLKEAFKENGFKVFDSDVNYLFFKNTKIKNLKIKLEKRAILIRSFEGCKNLNEYYFRAAVKKKGENTFLIKELEKLRSEEENG